MTWHSTCHSLRELNVGDAPLRLLRAVKGIDLVELPDANECCGFGGTFAVKNADVSMAMLSDKLRCALDTRAEVGRRGRQLVPDAHRRRPLARAHRRAGGAPGPDPGLHRGAARAVKGFPAAAREALQDTQLRRNLGHATRTIRAKRAGVVGELPDWEELRSAGEAIKDRVLAGLDGYLEQLEESVTRAGGHVHWARDGDEANRIVREIAQGHGVSEVVKVKSIVTDEIGLNEALAEAGIAAVETDLAELIIQLDHDEPSHILVPAIHKNRAEIRDLFRRELERAENLTDDPPKLTEAARKHLRAKFLSARMGISGANFAIAETGTVCVVESEGNGRMCTSLPDVLVTVMGIEKLMPTWQDLEVFLQLLPRSSTGERMNPYTSFWIGDHGRRRSAGVPPGAARQRAHGHAGRRGRPAGAAVHPLQRLPERVPGLLAHGRPRLRVRVSGADRGDPHPAARTSSRKVGPCLGRRASAGRATRSARSRSRSRRCWCTCAGGSWTQIGNGPCRIPSR